MEKVKMPDWSSHFQLSAMVLGERAAEHHVDYGILNTLEAPTGICHRPKRHISHHATMHLRTGLMGLESASTFKETHGP